jgi:transmembrane sensor
MSQMTPSNEQILAAIAEQAGAWFVENRSGPLNSEARASFITWLRASPVHVQEYLGIAALAGDLAEAVKDPQVSPESLLAEARADVDNVVSFGRPPPMHAPARPRLRESQAWSLASAAAAALVFVTVAAVWSGRDGERFGLPKTYSTAHGEQRVRQLPDGSALHLNTDSAVTVRYSRAERIVDLDRGEALFQVAPDSKRRFRVAAGEAGVLAVGTEFDVYRRIGAVTVTVVEGTVAVFTGAPPPRTPTNLLPPTALRVDAGYQVEVRRRVGSPRPVDARAAVAWLERKIAFENRPLGEVADEFNRYGRIVIEIDDQDLRATPISGVFDAYDTDSFAAFLETLEGVIVQKTPTRIRVLKMTSAKRARLPVAQ